MNPKVKLPGLVVNDAAYWGGLSQRQISTLHRVHHHNEESKAQVRI